jgi:pimeloyl-ACP methyl ester carboxylesterase
MDPAPATARLFHADSAPQGASGLPLVLIHGAGGTHRQWPEAVRSLAGRRVIALDLPGHGASPGPGRRAIAAYAADVLAVLDALGIGRAVLVGHSMGGAIALTLALEAPARVAGLGLVGTGARLRVAQAILEATADPARYAAAAEGMADWAFGPGAGPELRREHVEGMRACPAEVVHGDFAACDAFDVRDRLVPGAVAAPAAVICGDADRLTPPRYAAFLHQRIEGSRLLLVPGAGHMVALEAPAATIAALAAL